MIKALKTSICLILFTVGLSYADPKIAYLGYGSLIDDPRDLPISEPFQENGPQLPIDFLRISGSYIGSSSKHDDTLYGAFCDKKDPARKDHPLYLSVTIAPKEFAEDVVKSKTFTTDYDKAKDTKADPEKTDFDNARQALMTREGTNLADNIAYITKDPKTGDFEVSTRAKELSDNDIKSLEDWMTANDTDTLFFTYFSSNFHDLQYGRGMESITKYVKGISDTRDITKWNQDNIRLLMFLVANNKANIAGTRYDALEKFKSYLYEVPANVKNNTTYWQKGPYAHTAGLSGLITDVFNYPRIHTRVLQDSNAYVDCSGYVSPVKGD